MAMRLIRKTYSYTALWMIPVVVLGSLFVFLMIRYIAYEEIDEFLAYEMDRLVSYHQEHQDLPDFHNAVEIIPDLSFEQPFYKDTLILETGDNELIPYRELWFTIQHEDRDFTIVLRHLMLGKDDVFQGSMIILAGLVILIAVMSMLALNQVKQRIWKPFYQTLSTIRQHKIEDPPPHFPETDIDEFMQLNKALQGFMKKMSDDFRNNKAFNENASHELQTHLSVIRANTEKLINEAEPGAPGLEELGRIGESAGKLSRIQKSLMLLSRIHNREFSNLVPLDLKKVLDSVLPVFEDPISLRNIQTTISASQCPLVMDEGLAEILVGNLVKNAVKYNVPDGYIRIALDALHFEIANPGKPFEGDPAMFTQRFAKGPDGNTGIGLAIVGQICELYGFRLSYQVESKTEHKITVFFSS